MKMRLFCRNKINNADSYVNPRELTEQRNDPYNRASTSQSLAQIPSKMVDTIEGRRLVNGNDEKPKFVYDLSGENTKTVTFSSSLSNLSSSKESCPDLTQSILDFIPTPLDELNNSRRPLDQLNISRSSIGSALSQLKVKTKTQIHRWLWSGTEGELSWRLSDVGHSGRSVEKLKLIFQLLLLYPLRLWSLSKD